MCFWCEQRDCEFRVTSNCSAVEPQTWCAQGHAASPPQLQQELDDIARNSDNPGFGLITHSTSYVFGALCDILAIYLVLFVDLWTNMG